MLDLKVLHLSDENNENKSYLGNNIIMLTSLNSPSWEVVLWSVINPSKSSHFISFLIHPIVYKFNSSDSKSVLRNCKVVDHWQWIFYLWIQFSFMYFVFYSTPGTSLILRRLVMKQCQINSNKRFWRKSQKKHILIWRSEKTFK